MTSAAGGFLDLSSLSSQLQILPLSPSWRDVEEALGRLELPASAATSDEQKKEDLDLVKRFVASLRENHDTLVYALVGGAVLGQVSSGETFGERLLYGLRAVSECHRLDRLTEKEKRGRLRKLWEKLRQEKLISEEVSAKRKDLASLRQEAWHEWGDELQRAVQPGTDNQGGLRKRFRDGLETDWRPAAWNAWDLRLIDLVSQSRKAAAPDEPELADLVCAAAGVSPSSLLRFDLDRMTLIDWSEVFLHALAGLPREDPRFCPLWAMVPALQQLELRDPRALDVIHTLSDLADTVYKWRVGPTAEERQQDLWADEKQRTQQWTAMARPVSGPPRAALLVRREKGSLLATWKPVPDCPALAVTSSQLLGLLKRWSSQPVPLPLAAMGFAHLVVEIQDDPEQSEWDAMRILRQFASQTSKLRLSAPKLHGYLNEVPVEARLGAPVLPLPSDLESLFRLLPSPTSGPRPPMTAVPS